MQKYLFRKHLSLEVLDGIVGLFTVPATAMKQRTTTEICIRWFGKHQEMKAKILALGQ